MNHDDHVHDTLTCLFQLATDEALLATIEALAAEIGVSTIQGLPPLQFFEQAKMRKAKDLVAGWADKNPSFASDMKRAWDALDSSSTDEPPE